MTNEELKAVCDGTTDEEVCVWIPVKEVRRLLKDSKELAMLVQPSSMASTAFRLGNDRPAPSFE